MNKKILLLIMILTLIISITSSTYAYLFFTTQNNGIITGDMANIDVKISVTKVYPLTTSTNTGVIVPQLETSLSNALKAGCIDSNTNIVCQVYKVNVKNDGDATGIIDLMLNFYANRALTTDITTTMPNLRWKQVSSVNESTPSSSVLGTSTTKTANGNRSNIANKFVTNDILDPGDNDNYYIIVWLNETNGDQAETGKSFYGNVTLNAANGTGITSAFTS